MFPLHRIKNFNVQKTSYFKFDSLVAKAQLVNINTAKTISPRANVPGKYIFQVLNYFFKRLKM